LTDISELVRKLKEKGAGKVILQFPEGLKRQALTIAQSMKKAGFQVIISGDPCYGACDLKTSLLGPKDILVHFGHSPLGTDPRVIFEPWRMDFPLQVLDNVLPVIRSGKVGIVTTVQHAHMIPGIVRYLAEHGIDASTGSGGLRAPHEGQILGCSYEAARQCTASEILFIGTGRFHPLGVQLATGARVIALDPFQGTVEEVVPERFMRKRFALIEKAKAAPHFGIILSEKPGQRRQELAEYLAGIRDEAYIVSMTEVSPGELLNLGFAAYVNTACPRLAYDDQERFPVPVITPCEFEIVCGVRTFDEYRIDEIF
jgi:2-(3-amino-3-carboxypropyl)histidine synthase